MQLCWIGQNVEGPASICSQHTVRKERSRRCPTAPGSTQVAVLETHVPAIAQVFEDSSKHGSQELMLNGPVIDGCCFCRRPVEKWSSLNGSPSSCRSRKGEPARKESRR
ncbi:Inositol-pentakisphosphate 2-kinase [Manis javanica]|nr:Inositol-pentakisphosphate 2-kinase [Manis javanica]